jgi:hypothetical protein
MRSQRPGSVRENGLRFKLATLCLIGSATCALGQQTVTVPPPTPIPSTLPQAQTFTSCLMNCDTAAGTC